MIRFLNDIPQRVFVAFSGGVDSLAVAHFLKRGKKDVTLLHYNHACEFSDSIQQQCEAMARDVLGLPIIVGTLEQPKPKGDSLEAHWRKYRYQFLRVHSFHQDPKHPVPVLTCHHLDDAVESWVWSALNGNPHLIQPKIGTILRPFLITEKQEFIDYCATNELEPVADPYNDNPAMTRNFIRHELLPMAYRVNPGLKKVIKKKYLETPP